jgi:ATP-dependent DNA helicase RecG
MSPGLPSSQLPDWIRLHKALSVEVNTGFNDLMGKQHCFSQFLADCLADLITQPFQVDLDTCKGLIELYQNYAQLTFAQRQHLIADTRRLIDRTRRAQEQLALNPTSPQASEARSPNPSLSLSLQKRIPSPQISSDQNLKLDQPLQYLPGIGARSAELLARLGLYTIQDALYYYPRDYIDYARQLEIQDLVAGETVTLVATVKRCNCFTSPRNTKLTILDLQLRDRTGQIKVSRFYAGNRYSNRAWQEQLKRQYAPGTRLAASGLVKEGKYGLTLDNPELEVLGEIITPLESDVVGRIIPIYPLTEGVTADLVRKVIKAALPAIRQLQDPFPDTLRSQYDLIPLPRAITQIHVPQDQHELTQARHRLVFDEFFYLQLGLLQRRQQQKATQASAVLPPNGVLIERFYNNVLPFQLTNAQQRVVNEILGDLQRPTPMNRLVQGDVGSGKTVVAVIALLSAIQAGYQGTLMAPTEVLAEQHYHKFVTWFNALHLSVELLTGSTTTKKRRQILSELETGELPLLVGTHALIENPVIFQRLGLVVIDEQHRFGVQQRARLQQKGDNPHVLTMTATPIPRTLALTLHGDLDVSQIDELPPGRQPIQTTVVSSRDRLEVYTLIRREIVQGRQAYVIFPLVEESEKLDLRSAIEEHQRMQDSIFPELGVGLLHGRMNSQDKEQALQQFRDLKTQILVSTTVVEVGVDVPNATVMLIEHAERFGLSQLHQLRGRVGRGSAQSFCLLMSSSKSETARQRLKVLEQSQDGFFIAEMDLRFRGPGEVLGTRQSGLPDFALASLVEDQQVLELARQASENMIRDDPTLATWPLLKAELVYRYQKLMGGGILT